MTTRPPIPESLHWYTKAGEPVFKIKKRNPKKGEDPYTDRIFQTRAEEYKFQPGTTSVIKEWLGMSFGLEEYIINLALNSGHEAGVKGLTVDQGREGFNISRATAPSRGKELHADVEEFYRTGKEPSDPAAINIIAAIESWRDRTYPGGKLFPELPFASSIGHGGRLDILLQTAGMNIIPDIKTVESDQSFERVIKKPYEKWGLQQAAYGLGLLFPTEECCSRMESEGVDTDLESVRHVQVIARQSDGATHFYEWDSDAMAMYKIIFTRQLMNWVDLHGYDPSEGKLWDCNYD